MTKPCCQDPSNLDSSSPRSDLKVSTCKVCGCRHFELTADLGVLFPEGKSVT